MQGDPRAVKVSIREPGVVKMGELSFVMAHKVNGVSALHTELMKTTVFQDLNQAASGPDRQRDQRRHAAPLASVLQPRLARTSSPTIGEDWVGDLDQLSSSWNRMWTTPPSAPPTPRPKRANKADLAELHGVRAWI
jgi:starch phosphorylase